MLTLFKKIFIHNWQRKSVALILAITIWILINNSITVTRTFSGVTMRVVNLPPSKTVEGLLPDGILEKQITLTLSGRKSVIDALSPGDLEVIIDARGKGDQWIVHITKQMLVCINPNIDLASNISEIQHAEFVLKLTPLVTEKIPIFITAPTGEPPPGYQYLDIWPQSLYQTVSGPKGEVEELKISGLELTFDLSAISEKDLESISAKSTAQNDEISFPVPPQWKKVHIPFNGNQMQAINDPSAELLRIDFLRKALLAIDTPLPIFLFFPLKTSALINPGNTRLANDDTIAIKDGIFIFSPPLFAGNVSRLFLDIVRNNLAMSFIIAEKDDLAWSIQFINSKALENAYIARAKSDFEGKQLKDANFSLNEAYLRIRFRNYMRKLELFNPSGVKLQLAIELQDSQILIKNIN